MQRCELTLNSMGHKADLDNVSTLVKIVKRLPVYLQSRWADQADRIIQGGKEPTFLNLATFIEEKARIANTQYGLILDQANTNRQTEKRNGSRDRCDEVMWLPPHLPFYVTGTLLPSLYIN